MFPSGPRLSAAAPTLRLCGALAVFRLLHSGGGRGAVVLGSCIDQRILLIPTSTSICKVTLRRLLNAAEGHRRRRRLAPGDAAPPQPLSLFMDLQSLLYDNLYLDRGP